MASDEFDPEEIDRLVKELKTPSRPPAPQPPVTASAAAPTVTSATDHGALAPGRRWTTARLLMPSARTEPSKAFAFASALSLPVLPQIALPKIALPELNETQWGVLSARMFAGLGVLLSAAMPYWPYANAWSWGLLVYLCAVMLVVVTGIWGAKLTWDARLPAAHTVALGNVIWGLGLLAAEAAPRIGSA